MDHGAWPDDEIVRRLHRDDERAFDVLMERFYQPLLHFVIDYLHDSDAAEDVIQDVFVWLWHRRASIAISTALKPYLYAAARHAALNAKSRRITRGRYEADVADGMQEYHAEPVGSANLEEQELTQALEQAIHSLSPRSREVYTLGMRHGLTYREIAEILGISIPTAQTHLMRALSALRSSLRPFLALAVFLTYK